MYACMYVCMYVYPLEQVHVIYLFFPDHSCKYLLYLGRVVANMMSLSNYLQSNVLAGLQDIHGTGEGIL